MTRPAVLAAPTLVAVALAAGCSGDPCEPAWAPVLADLDRAVLSVNGRATDDLYAAGGDLGSGGGPLALRYDGEAWTAIDTGQQRTLWWAWPAPDADEAWLVGEGGTVLRERGGAVESLDSGAAVTFYGAWGASADDVWIVGGTPGGVAPAEDKDVVLHYSGGALTRDTGVPARGAALFKVWGSGPDDVYAVGEGGTLLHRGPDGWTDLSDRLGSSANLLTVHGCGPDEVYAVGGQEVWRWDGATWAAAAVDVPGQVNGVTCGIDGVTVVGNAGLVLRYDRAADTWTEERLAPPADTDLHAAWVAPGGDVWASGGNFNIPPGTAPRVGAVAARACDPPDGEIR